jgi:hypothetical protein
VWGFASGGLGNISFFWGLDDFRYLFYSRFFASLHPFVRLGHAEIMGLNWDFFFLVGCVVVFCVGVVN